MEQCCNGCGKKKDIECFRNKKRKNTFYRLKECHECEKLHKRKKYENLKNNNPEKYKEMLTKRKDIDKKRYTKMRTTLRKQQNAYYAKNKEKIQQQRKEYRKKYPDKAKAWRRGYNESIQGKIGMNLRRRIRKEIGTGKQWLEYLGCEYSHLKEWFEYNFQLDGNKFTWDNYGTVWSIDHVWPCKSFDLTDPKQIKRCFNWTNTMPVSKRYNEFKNDRIFQKDILKLYIRLVDFHRQIENRLKSELPANIRNYVGQMV